MSFEFKGFLLDAYGVFWAGNDCGLLPGSKETMQQLVLSGKIVGILSNSTQMAHKEISKLHQHGLVQGEHYHFLITSGELARTLFLTEKLPFKGNKFWVFGGVHPRFSSYTLLFEDTSYTETAHIDDADFIYLSVPHINGEDQTDPEVFREEIEKIKSKNLPMICANPDLFAHEGQPPRVVVRQGSIGKLYEEMGGEVFYIGKPYREAYSTAIDQFRKLGVTNINEILMVGDTPETDIRGARTMGMPTALVMTGIMADRISQKGQETALEELLAENTPDYFIQRITDVICPSLKS